jgi:hypothetical protein
LLIHPGPRHPNHADDIEQSDALPILTGGSPWDEWVDDHPADPCAALYFIRDPSSRSATA